MRVMGSGIKTRAPDMVVVGREAYVGHVCSKRSARHVCHKTVQYIGKKRVRSSVQREQNKIRITFNLHVMVEMSGSAGLFVVASRFCPELSSRPAVLRPPLRTDTLRRAGRLIHLWLPRDHAAGASLGDVVDRSSFQASVRGCTAGRDP